MICRGAWILCLTGLAGCHWIAPHRAGGGDLGAKDRTIRDLVGEGLSHDAGDALALDVPASDAPGEHGEDLASNDMQLAPASWVLINVGKFSMGAPSNELCVVASHEVLHEVNLTASIEIQSTEVTQGQYEAAMGPGSNPSLNPACGPSCPVENVTWHAAARYCNALSASNGLPLCYNCPSTTCTTGVAYGGQDIYTCPGYRLPTEAEWELAYRATGTTPATTSTHYYNGVLASACDNCSNPDATVDAIGWYCANTNATQPVGLKASNAVGLYDMAGNVWEWCHDMYRSDLGSKAVTNPWGEDGTPTMRVIRGGGFNDQPRDLRASSRRGVSAALDLYYVGFRCVRRM